MHLNGNHYSVHSSLQYGAAHAHLGVLSFKGDESLLDIGCGDGRITEELSLRVPHGKVIGVDFSEEMIKHANLFHEKPNLSFQVTNAEDLSWEDAFDVVTCLSCIHWVYDQKKALQKIFRALKPHGQALIVTYSSGMPFAHFVDYLREDPRFKKHSRPSRFFSPEEYQSMAHQIGFSCVEVTAEKKVSQYDHSQALKDYWRGWAGCVVDLPFDEQEEFLDAACQIAPRFSITSNMLSIPYQLVTIFLRK